MRVSTSTSNFEVLSRIGAGSFEIAVSVPLALEYEDVLLRQAGEGGRSMAMVGDLIDYICSVAICQPIFFLWRPLLPDPDDDMILELAVAAGCNAIVTHNVRDFRLAVQFGVAVLKPAIFLKQLGARP
jgi:predicted nucleic acid-binding protein